MATLSKLIVVLGLDGKEYYNGLDDAERKAGTSGKAITNGLADIGGAVIVGGIAAVATGLGAMAAGLTKSVAEASEAEDVMAQLNAVLESTGEVATVMVGGVTEEVQKQIDTINGALSASNDDIISLGEDLAAKRLAIETGLSESLEEIAEWSADKRASIEEQHISRIADLQRSIMEVESDYASDRANREEDLRLKLGRMEEDYTHDRESLLEDLAAAESDTERARLQERIDEMDYEFNTRKKRMEEDAAIREKREQEEAAKRINTIRQRIDDENKEYSKQTAMLATEQAKREADVRERYDKEIKAAEERYQKELIEVNKFIDATKAKLDELQKEPIAVNIIRPTIDMVTGLANSFMGLTKFGDEAILSGENLLLTFTNIGKDIFPDATETMLDMSQALGQDISSSAIQLGKALQDPVLGVTALRRVGVNFTEEQQEMINSMVESGDIMGAQKLILAELSKEFGGSAVAAGKTLTGQWTILGNQFSNVAENVGNSLIPILSQFLNEVIIPLVPHLETLGNVLAAALAGEDTTAIIGALPAQLQPAAEAIIWLGETVLGFVTEGLPNLINGFKSVVEFLQNNEGVVVGILTALGVAVGVFVFTVVVPAIAAFVTAWGPVLLIMAAAAVTGYNLYKVFTDITGVGEILTAWLKKNFPEAYAVAETAIGSFVEKAKAWWEKLKEVIAIIWQRIREIIDRVLEIVGNIMDAFQSAREGDWRGFGENLRKAWDNSLKLIVQILETAWENIKLIFSTVISSVIEFFITTDWAQVGKDIMQGIVNGIVAGAQWILDAALRAVRAATEAVKGFLGIHSPSALFRDEIGYMMAAGLAEGWSDGLRGLETDIPAISSVRSMQPVFVNVNYAPMISTADRYEAERVLAPIIEAKLRLGAK